MHPLLSSPQRLALYLASWLVVAMLLVTAYATASGTPRAQALLIVVPVVMAYAFVCLSAWYVCRATPLAGTEWTQILMTQSGSGLLAAGLWLLMWEVWTRTLEGFPSLEESVDQYRSQLPLIMAAGVMLYWAAAMFHYLLIAFERSREADRRELGLEVLAREAELKALRAQIDPHFLFNSLHSISALTATDPPGARRMCLLLADFFRSSVRLGAKDSVPLAQEIEMIHQYLDIEKVRCGDRLQSIIEVDRDCDACQIPPLILQPLVENSVRHGIQSLVAGGTIRIHGSCRGGELALTVENPVDETAPKNSGPGVGLSNVKRRLRTLFANQAGMDVIERDGSFRVELTLPCRHGESGEGSDEHTGRIED